MGYTTNFTGKMKIDPPLNSDQVNYINKFNNTRRMSRDASICAKMPDPVREAVGLPVGIEGEFFVGGLGFAGQDNDKSILEHNSPSSTQPGLWCQWEVTENGKYLKWDGGEKFYDYIEWLRYIQDNMLKPWGSSLEGTIKWKGEDSSDRGAILAIDGEIISKEGKGYAELIETEKRERQAKKEKSSLENETNSIKENKPQLSVRQKM